MQVEGSVGQARERLVDAVWMYRLQPEHRATDAINAATHALVAGLDSPALRELAGASRHDGRWTLDPLVESVAEDFALPVEGHEETQARAAGAMCRKAVRRETSLREVAAWAHQVIGHEGASEVQPLVELDDQYDLVDIGPTTLQDVEATAALLVARLANDLRP